MAYLKNGILYGSPNKPIIGLPYIVQFGSNIWSLFALDINGDVWYLNFGHNEAPGCVIIRKIDVLKDIVFIHSSYRSSTLDKKIISSIDSNGVLFNTTITQDADFDKKVTFSSGANVAKIIKTAYAVILGDDGRVYGLDDNNEYSELTDAPTIMDICAIKEEYLLLDRDNELWCFGYCKVQKVESPKIKHIGGHIRGFDNNFLEKKGYRCAIRDDIPIMDTAHVEYLYGYDLILTSDGDLFEVPFGDLKTEMHLIDTDVDMLESQHIVKNNNTKSSRKVV